PHPERSFQVVLGKLRLEVAQFPLGANDFHAVAVDHRDAGAVVAAVLEFLESADDDGNDVTVSDVSNDSAHDLLSLRIAARETVLRASPDRHAGRLRQTRRSAAARPGHSEGGERSGCNTAWNESDPHLELS